MHTIETILQVRLGEEFFGIDSNEANQILRVPPITPMPLTQEALRGIVVLNGKVVPVIDLKVLLGKEPVASDQEESRIITVKVAQQEYAIVVDEVIDAINFTAENFEESAPDEKLVIGFYKYEDELIQLLEVAEIIQDDMIESFEPLEVEQLMESQTSTLEQESETTTQRYLFFRAGSESYAVSIDLVAELIFVPETITPIAGSDAVSLGAITLRDAIIDVIDFNMLFGFEAVDQSDLRARLLILGSEEKKLGLCVADVIAIKDIATSNMEAITMTGSENRIEALYKEGEKIVSIISSIYLKEQIDNYCVSTQSLQDEEHENGNETMRELAVFALGNEEFAFDIEGVQEIISYQEVTPMPESKEYVEGVINLRGAIIPVINLPKKLNFEPKITEKSKIIVCTIEGEHVGFLVDDVNDIMFIEDRYVAVSKNSQSITKATISLDGGRRVILELRLDRIISKEDIAGMKED